MSFPKVSIVMETRENHVSTFISLKELMLMHQQDGERQGYSLNGYTYVYNLPLGRMGACYSTVMLPKFYQKFVCCFPCLLENVK